MKKLLNILVLLILTSAFAQTQAYKGLNFGMDKNQVKKELKTQKKVYQNIIFAGHEFKIYKEGCVYDTQGKLSQIFFNYKEGGMYGIEFEKALNIYNDLIQSFTDDGCIVDSNTKTGNSIKYNLVATFHDKEKTQSIILGLSKLNSYTSLTKVKGNTGYLFITISEFKH